MKIVEGGVENRNEKTTLMGTCSMLRVQLLSNLQKFSWLNHKIRNCTAYAAPPQHFC